MRVAQVKTEESRRRRRRRRRKRRRTHEGRCKKGRKYRGERGMKVA